MGNSPSRSEQARQRGLLNMIERNDVQGVVNTVPKQPFSLSFTFPPGLTHGGCTPLQVAAGLGHEEMVDALMKYGADPFQCNRRNESTLYHAVKGRSLPIVHRFIRLYKPESLNVRTSSGDYALLAAVRLDVPEIVEALVDAGADVEVTNSHLHTPLHLAAASRRVESLVWVLNRRPAVDVRDAQGNTPLMLAAYYAFPSGVSLLLNRGADATLANNKGRSVFSAACQGGSVQVAKLLRTVLPTGAVNAVTSQGSPPLHWAVMGCTEPMQDQFGPSIAMVEYLVKTGADLHQMDARGRVALHIVAINANTASQHAMHNSCLLTRKLLAMGIAPNVTDDNGCTPLHYALNGGDIEPGMPVFTPAIRISIAFVLLSFGADIRVRDRTGSSPLDIAMRWIAAGRSVKSGPEKLLFRALDMLANCNDMLSRRALAEIEKAAGSVDEDDGAASPTRDPVLPIADRPPWTEMAVVGAGAGAGAGAVTTASADTAGLLDLPNGDATTAVADADAVTSDDGDADASGTDAPASHSTSGADDDTTGDAPPPAAADGDESAPSHVTDADVDADTSAPADEPPPPATVPTPATNGTGAHVPATATPPEVVAAAPPSVPAPQASPRPSRASTPRVSTPTSLPHLRTRALIRRLVADSADVFTAAPPLTSATGGGGSGGGSGGSGRGGNGGRGRGKANGGKKGRRGRR